jgi:hypothetical protein
MKTYSRPQEKHATSLAINEGLQFLIEAKRDEREACTNLQIKRTEQNFNMWRNAVHVLYPHTTTKNCVCENMDSMLSLLFRPGYYSRYVWGF